MLNKLKGMLSKLRNARFYFDLESARKEAVRQIENHHDTVVCEYCGAWMPKEEAVMVYDIENNRMEYSHEECWNKNNTVSDTEPTALAEKGTE